MKKYLKSEVDSLMHLKPLGIRKCFLVMKILILHSHMTRVGGAQHFIQEIANRLVEEFHEVAIVAAAFVESNYSLDPRIQCISVANLDAKDLTYWLMLPIIIKRMKRIIKDYRPDVVIANHFPSYVALSESNVNGVWMCQEPYPFFHDKKSLGTNILDQLKAHAVSLLFIKYDIRSARRISKICANSRFSKSLLYKAYGRNGAVVYPGFDQEILDIQTGKKVLGRVLSVSPTAPRKGFEFTIDAYVQLAQEGLASELRVIGRIHPSYEKMIEKAEQKNADLNITKLGIISRSELFREYASATLLSYPSIAEPFGMVPVESVALGTPVIYFKRGGPLDTMIDNLTGFGVTPGDSRDYTDKMREMLSNPITIDTKSDVIRKHLNRFTWSRASAILLHLGKLKES